MSRRVMGARFEVAQRDHFTDRVKRVDRWKAIHRQPEHPALLRRVIVEDQIVPVEVDRNAQGTLGRGDARDVINVRMRQEDPPDDNLLPRRPAEQQLHLVARVDERTLARARTGHDESVLEERANRARLDYDHDVILAILDDLMFSSKIKTAAKQLGVPVSIVRSSEGALADMRTHLPTLVIFDLNNPRTDPIGTVSAMKADPSLASIPTVGFSQHTQTDAIEAARRAGVGEVLARGAFFERLADILVRGR